jgi:SAM-dependent methyltransferase
MGKHTTGGFDGSLGVISGRLMAKMNADMELAAAALVAPSAGERILVIGPGPGVGIDALLDLEPHLAIVAIDPSAAMCALARRRHRADERVAVSQATLLDVPDTGAFDAAVCVNAQQLWSPHRDNVAALADQLRGGARLVTITHDWAITKRQPLGAWRLLVTHDLGRSGFEEIAWGTGDYRTGAATVLTARRQRCAAAGDAVPPTPPVG